MKYPNLEKLVDIIAVLRSENGCEWDREQTHKSLRPNMLEEAYEAVDAIDDGDIPNLREELGDVLLQVVLHAQIAKDNNEFDIEDVAKELSEKLIHRHPHVFGNQKVKSTQDIIDNWDKLKKEEKTYRKSVLDGISKSQSALMSAQKISKKVVKVGFEWNSVDSLKKCIKSEYKEFEEAVKEGKKSASDGKDKDSGTLTKDKEQKCITANEDPPEEATPEEPEKDIEKDESGHL